MAGGFEFWGVSCGPRPSQPGQVFFPCGRRHSPGQCRAQSKVASCLASPCTGYVTLCKSLSLSMTYWPHFKIKRVGFIVSTTLVLRL